MYTFLSIIGFIILNVIFRILIETNLNNNNKNLSKKEITDKVDDYLVKIVFINFLILLFVIYKINTSDQKKSEDILEVVENDGDLLDGFDVQEVEPNLSDDQLYLKSKGLDYIKYNPNDSLYLQILKRFDDEIGFGNQSACAFLFDVNQLTNNEYDIFLKKYKKYDIEKITLFLTIYCTDMKTVVEYKKGYETEQPKPDVNPCQISIDFIKKDLYNPSSIDYSLFDCNQEWNGYHFIILRKISAKNSFGQKKEFVYKVKLKYLGGHQYDMSSWELISIQSEEL